MVFAFAAALIVLAGAVTLFLGNAIARAQSDESNPPAAEAGEEFLAFGVTGIVHGQSARLHAVAVGVPHDQPVELLIFDNDGNLLAHSTQRLSPGHAVTLNLPYTGSPTNVNRMEFHAVVRFINRKPRKGYVISTIEVVDDLTGGTIYAVADPEG